MPDHLTPAAERLLANVTADWDMDPHGEYDRARAELVADLASIQSEARATADAEVAALTAERDALRAALGFYADPDTYRSWPSTSRGAGGQMFMPPNIDHDSGTIARAALAPSPAEGEAR